MSTIKKIRLNSEYIRGIKELAIRFFNSNDVKIFGSRTDLNKKGGDIDIYIKTKLDHDILKAKISFLREFEKRFGDQKVDLIVQYGKQKNKITRIADTEGISI